MSVKIGDFSARERRRFPRFKDNIFMFSNLNLNLQEEFKAFFSRDISGGGVRFETEEDLSPESELELEIYQPLDRRKKMIFSIPVLAKLVWSRKIEKDDFEEGENKYSVGIEFSKLRAEDRQRIVNYIEENR